MKKSILIVLTLLLTFVFTGCSNNQTKLLSAERSSDANNKYGEVEMREVKIKDPIDKQQKDAMEFEDGLIKAQFYFTDTTINFILENKEDSDIKINWDNCIFINENGASKRIIHKGISFENKEMVQEPSKIQKNKKIYDEITPEDNIYYYKGPNTSIFKGNLLEYIEEWRVRGLTEKSLANVGLLLYLEINDMAYEYLFNFNREKKQVGTNTEIENKYNPQ